MKLAQGKRKQAGRKTAGKPITAHPLFPAIVALWFGALFGLGSLAIRPALLEALVLKLHIDLVIPAAAPPLGMTARILLSLGMALLGGTLGALIARRIARPRPEVRERRRGPLGGAVAPRRDDYQPAPAEAPAARRRALAVEEDYEPSYHHEYAPLPGGAPQILDVSEFDFAQDDVAPARPVAAPVPEPASAGALDLSGFLAGEAAPAAPFAAPAPAAAEPAPALSPDFSRDAASQPAFAAPARGFDAPATAPSFARFDAPAAEPVAQFAPLPAAAPDLIARPFAAPSAPPETAAPAAPLALPNEPAPEPAAEPAPESSGDDAVDQIHAAALEALSQVELIERLARGLQRRRALAGSTAPAAYALLAEAFPAPEEAPLAAAPPAGASPVESAAEASAEPLVVPPFQAAEPVFAAPLPESTPESAPEAAAEPAATPPLAVEPIVVPPIAMPAALRPVGLDLDDDLGDDDLAAFLPPRHIAMPAAAPETPAPEVAGPAPESAPAPLAEALATPPFAAPSAAPLADHAADAEPVAEVEDDVLADGYSSLLDLSRPAPLRTGFVRIEEPDEEVAAPEPVVVFPGQAQRFAAARPAVEAMATAPSAPVAAVAAPAEGAGALRRFDAPASTGPGGAPISAAPATMQDREEAERALRTALATLQRMSATG